MDADILRTLTEIADEYPTTLVSRVVDKFIRGEVSGQSFEFPPKPPMFSKALKAEPYAPEEQEAKRKEIRRSLNVGHRFIEASGDIEKPTPEQKERVAKLLASFKQQTEINRGDDRGASQHQTMTPQRAEYWRKIAAIKDAKEVTEEHLANRRRVQMQASASA